MDSYMTRAERVERLILDRKSDYEVGDLLGKSMVHWVDTVQSVANGCQSSEIDVPETCRDDLMDTVKDDVALGVKLGRTMKPGDECFSATVCDADGRALHFFFVAPSEDVVVERLIAAFSKGVES